MSVAVRIAHLAFVVFCFFVVFPCAHVFQDHRGCCSWIFPAGSAALRQPRPPLASLLAHKLWLEFSKSRFAVSFLNFRFVFFGKRFCRFVLFDKEVIGKRCFNKRILQTSFFLKMSFWKTSLFVSQGFGAGGKLAGEPASYRSIIIIISSSSIIIIIIIIVK